MSDANCCGTLSINGANLSSEWEQIESLPISVYQNSAVSVDGKIYILGGIESSGKLVRDLYVYDPEMSQYTKKANMMVAKSHISTIAEYDGYIYVIGGQIEVGGTFGSSNSAHRYCIETNQWEQIANLPTKRTGMSVIQLNGLIYTIGGWASGDDNVGIVEVYDPLTNKWSRKKSMSTARRYPSAFVYNEKIYVAGGLNEIEKKSKNIVEVYDPILDSWSSVSQMHEERHAFGIAEHGGFFYAFGGVNSSGSYLDTIEKYNPVMDSWTPLKCRMPEKISAFGIASLSSSTYIFGATRNTPVRLSISYKYTPTGIDAPTIRLISDNTIDWEEVQGASSYNVCRKIDDGSYELIAENVTDTSFTDNKQEPGKTYYYVVRSVNEEGVSCHSNEVLVEVEEKPTYDRALLVIRTVNDDWFEYDLTEEEVNDFVHWYDNVPSDDLKAYYVFDKDFNIGPFKSRKDHIVHDKIVFFEIKEY